MAFAPHDYAGAGTFGFIVCNKILQRESNNIEH